MESPSYVSPNWLLELQQVAGIGLGIVREIRKPSPTPLPPGATGVQVSTSPGSIALTTSPVVIVAAVAALVLIVWMVTK